MLPTLTIAHLIFFIRDAMPVLYAGYGVTPEKAFLEYAVILAILVCLFKLRKRIDEKEMVTYKYIFLGLLIAIPEGLFFTLYKNLDSFSLVFGHTLKIAFYYYLFRGVFVSTVTYPYEKLEEEQQKRIQQEKLALLGQMGAVIVHETKNSLATIKGISQLLKLIAEDEKVKRYAQKIDDATNEVNRIISDFLQLSRPKPPVLGEMSVNSLIEAMRSTLETSSLIKGVNLIILLSTEEKTVMCDEAQIKQVILNLCKNAIEAMEEVANPVLTVKTAFNSQKDEMFITISDNGKGMTEEQTSRIGTPFFTTKEKGTGLGLSLCFQIIKEHKGRIDIESKPGKGSAFTIRFPCKSQHLIQAAEPVSGLAV